MEEGRATEDFAGPLPTPATGWKHNRAKRMKGHFTGGDICISTMIILLCKMLPSLFLKILCMILSLDTSVKESGQRANELQYETPFFITGKLDS